MDEEFGVDNLLKETVKDEKQKVHCVCVCMCAWWECLCMHLYTPPPLHCPTPTFPTLPHPNTPPSPQAYTAQDLQGLAVQHKEDTFQEGRTVILTLKDSGVLDNDNDTLENVNIVEEEKVGLTDSAYKGWVLVM